MQRAIIAEDTGDWEVCLFVLVGTDLNQRHCKLSADTARGSRRHRRQKRENVGNDIRRHGHARQDDVGLLALGDAFLRHEVGAVLEFGLHQTKGFQEGFGLFVLEGRVGWQEFQQGIRQVLGILIGIGGEREQLAFRGCGSRIIALALIVVLGAHDGYCMMDTRSYCMSDTIRVRWI